ncbi:hypothetical protein CHS0354_010179 [Potamilus streckersoni]|uniref:Uncharacterized protein n=1 Tax=Potamilus streckersoni TaxID=2493646 RepID=A0AAE0S3A5_9BIVA|nr:hypothetical protein CHS0354_010179 [Potamilus streckersoni]
MEEEDYIFVFAKGDKPLYKNNKSMEIRGKLSTGKYTQDGKMQAKLVHQREEKAKARARNINRLKEKQAKELNWWRKIQPIYYVLEKPNIEEE